jgi:hypothetical protein
MTDVKTEWPPGRTRRCETQLSGVLTGCFGLVSWRFPATSSKAHSSLSSNQLHEGFNLLRNLSAVGAEILLYANSAKKCDD